MTVVHWIHSLVPTVGDAIAGLAWLALIGLYRHAARPPHQRTTTRATHDRGAT